MKSSVEKLLVGFYILIIQLVIAKSLTVDIRSINCYNYAPEWFKSFGCEVAQRNHTSFVNAYLILQQPAPRFNVRVMLDYIMATGTSVKLIDKNIDGCEYLEHSNEPKKSKLVYKYLAKYLNKIPVCPLEANFNYTINDFNVDVDDIPSYIPESTFRIVFLVSEKVDTQIGFKVEVNGKLSHKIRGK